MAPASRLKTSARIFINALREVFSSSLPLAAVIIIVCCFIAPLEDLADYGRLAAGYFCVVLGQAIFLQSLNVSVLPIGKLMGSSLHRLKKVFFIIFFGFVFGLLATVAEPALVVLARQTHMIMPIVNEQAFIWAMGAGVGLLVAFALFRTIKNLNMRLVFALLYALVFAVVFLVPEEFVALAFDGSGATTGDVSVPFILALGMGIAVTMSKTKSNEDNFGIIGLASVGPILAVFIYAIILKGACGGVLPAAGAYDPGAVGNVGSIITSNLRGVGLALAPVLIAFLPFQLFLIKLKKKDFLHILLGSCGVFLGLFIFLAGIDYGFAFTGKYIGEVFLDPARPEWTRWLLLPVGFILGAAITLTEPAVAVLGEQLEEITNGHIRKKTIRFTLALGIGCASLLSMVKILTEINILWFLLPLYVLALVMMKFTPLLFVGLAFDSGGVTGGALTSAFLTPLTLGAAQAVASTAGPGAQSALTNGFGIIAFISVTPLIAVQALGIIYQRKEKRSGRRTTTMSTSEQAGLTALAAKGKKSGSAPAQALAEASAEALPSPWLTPSRNIP